MFRVYSAQFDSPYPPPPPPLWVQFSDFCSVFYGSMHILDYM